VTYLPGPESFSIVRRSRLSEGQIRPRGRLHRGGFSPRRWPGLNSAHPDQKAAPFSRTGPILGLPAASRALNLAAPNRPGAGRSRLRRAPFWLEQWPKYPPLGLQARKKRWAAPMTASGVGAWP